MHEFWGRHTFGSVEGIEKLDLNNAEEILEILKKSIVSGGATIVDVLYKNFSPEGLSILVLLKESHVAVHTYPEHNSLFIEAYTCGRKANPETIVLSFIQSISHTKYNIETKYRTYS